MSGKKGDQTSWMRVAGVGTEFAAAVGGLAFFGYWIDNRFDSRPWALLIGVGVGLVGGTYNLIRRSMAAFEQQDEPHDEDEPPKP